MGVESATAKASDRIWAEVSGLPSGKRERRLFMVLQAFIDDSGNQPGQRLFVLAAVLSTSERWAAFSNDWQAVLGENPSLAYFKHSHARGLHGEFEHWTVEARNERVAELAHLVKRHAIDATCVAIGHEHFQAFLRSLPVQRRNLISDHPYGIATSRLIASTAAMLNRHSLGDVCDFYFDTQPGFDVEITALWPEVIKLLEDTPPRLLEGRAKPVIGTIPHFRSETEFLPLQAADMIAGVMRDATMTGTALACLKELEQFAEMHIIDESRVRALGEMLLDKIEMAHAADPRIPLIHYDHKKAARMRKNIRKGPKPHPRPSS